MYAALNTRLEKLHIFKLREKILFILSIKMQTLFKSNMAVKCFIFILFFFRINSHLPGNILATDLFLRRQTTQGTSS